MAFLSKYGAARHIYIPIVKRGVVDHAVSADWTPAAGDVKISKDGGAAANVTNLPAAIAMGNSTEWDFSITATEMQAAQVVITIADSATKAVEDSGFIIETYGNASAQHVVDLSDGVRAGLTALPNAAASAVGGLPVAVDTSGRVDVLKINGTSQTARDIGASVLLSAGTGTGQLDFTSGVVKANLAQILGTALTETAGQIAAAFKKVFDVASPVFTATSVNQTGDSFARLGAPAGASHAADVAAVKTDTAAIKVQTDKITFTVANQVDVNVLDWKSATAPAMTGDAFARLGAPAGASVSADIAAAKADTGSLVATAIIRTGTAQAGAAGTITLDAGASATTNFYSGDYVEITSGTGAGQCRLCLGYNGATKVQTITPSWAVNPDNTSVFAILPAGTVDLRAIAGAAVSATTAQLGVNVVNWKGSAAPAMTGDAFALIGTAGAGLTALGDTRIANLDATVSSRLATSGYTAPDNTSITSIKGKTDSLTFTVPGQVDGNIQYVNDTQVNGTGTSANPWGP